MAEATSYLLERLAALEARIATLEDFASEQLQRPGGFNDRIAELEGRAEALEDVDDLG